MLAMAMAVSLFAASPAPGALLVHPLAAPVGGGSDVGTLNVVGYWTLSTILKGAVGFAALKPIVALGSEHVGAGVALGAVIALGLFPLLDWKIGEWTGVPVSWASSVVGVLAGALVAGLAGGAGVGLAVLPIGPLAAVGLGLAVLGVAGAALVVMPYTVVTDPLELAALPAPTRPHAPVAARFEGAPALALASGGF